jgi:hypothetical protein
MAEIFGTITTVNSGPLMHSEAVTYMKTEYRRPMPRVRVQFRVTFSTSTKAGTGHMLELSVGGCCIESPVTVEPGSSLELRICAADIAWPLVIEAATCSG